MEKNKFWGKPAIAGVIGTAKNSASNPVPAYGGMFWELKTHGLFYNVKVIHQNTTSHTVSGWEDYISCYNYGYLNLYLPTSNRHPGRIIYVKRINKYVRVYGNGKNLVLHKPHIYWNR